MAQLKPTSRMYSGVKPLSAMYQGTRKMWEPPAAPPAGTPPLVVGYSNGYGAGVVPVSIVPVATGGVLTGDLLIHVVSGTGGALWSTPSGWTVWKADVITGSLITNVQAHVRGAGETSYSWTPSGAGTNSAHSLITVRGWSGTLGSIVVGADGTRAASGGTFSNTAPSIASPTDGLVLFISTERTSAFDVATPTISNSFIPVTYLAEQGGTAFETVYVAYKNVTGTTGTTTATYPSTQASNGLAFHVGIGP